MIAGQLSWRLLRSIELLPLPALATSWFSTLNTQPPTPMPKEIRLKKKEKALEITFNDGKQFRYPAELLRVETPSADNHSMMHSGKTRVVAGRRHVGIMSITPVGKYAISIQFDDLHNTGIFSWDFLYDLGLNKLSRIRAYLRALKQRGLSREPPRSRPLAVTKPKTQHT